MYCIMGKCMHSKSSNTYIRIYCDCGVRSSKCLAFLITWIQIRFSLATFDNLTYSSRCTGIFASIQTFHRLYNFEWNYNTYHSQDRMASLVLPASPNWYLSQISDSNRGGFYVFGARHDVAIFDTSSVPRTPPRYISSFCGHKDRVSCVKLGQIQSQLNICCSSADDLKVKLWDVNTQVEIQSHSEHKVRMAQLVNCLVSLFILAGDADYRRKTYQSQCFYFNARDNIPGSCWHITQYSYSILLKLWTWWTYMN